MGTETQHVCRSQRQGARVDAGAKLYPSSVAFAPSSVSDSSDGIGGENVVRGPGMTAVLLSCFTARKLSPESKGQFVFDGNVLITANDGRRLLATDCVIWWPSVSIFAVKERYTLNDAGQERQGRRTIFKIESGAGHKSSGDQRV